MIIVIRIKGQVEISESLKETLSRLRLRRKYSAVLIKPSVENMKLLHKIRNYVAYGSINKDALKELIKKRAHPVSTKFDVDSAIKFITENEEISPDIKPFFRLHSPRGGIDSKKHFGVSKKAVLGDNKDSINELLRRML